MNFALKKLSCVIFSFCSAMNVGTEVSAADNYSYATAVGQVAAAFEMQLKCNGVGSFGSEDYQPFVMEATEILKRQQGLRKQKMRKLLFYEQTVWIVQEKARVLAERGVNSADENSVCSFARKIAGKSDTIGQFLVRE